VDGTSITGLDTDGVAAKLRGQEGSSVWVKVARRRSEIPGVAGLPEGAPEVEYKQFRLRRAQVELNPIFATTMMMDDHVYGGWCVWVVGGGGAWVGGLGQCGAGGAKWTALNWQLAPQFACVCAGAGQPVAALQCLRCALLSPAALPLVPQAMCA
jgi:hypothetical protein